MLGVTLKDHKRNTCIRQNTKVEDVVKRATKQKWKWTGYNERHQNQVEQYNIKLGRLRRETHAREATDEPSGRSIVTRGTGLEKDSVRQEQVERTGVTLRSTDTVRRWGQVPQKLILC